MSNYTRKEDRARMSAYDRLIEHRETLTEPGSQLDYALFAEAFQELLDIETAKRIIEQGIDPEPVVRPVHDLYARSLALGRGAWMVPYTLDDGTP